MTRIRAMALAISLAVFGLLAVAAATTMPHLVAATSSRPAGHLVRLNARIGDASRMAETRDHADALVYRQQVRQAAQQAAEAAAQARAEAAAKAAAEAAAQAQAQAAAARAAQPAPAPDPRPQSVQGIIDSAFAPLGQGAVSWALRVAACESGDNPNAVNASSGASGLFQFLRSTWALTPYAGSSIFDPVANARAAAWLYSRGGPGNWQCS